MTSLTDQQKLLKDAGKGVDKTFKGQGKNDLQKDPTIGNLKNLFKGMAKGSAAGSNKIIKGMNK